MQKIGAWIRDPQNNLFKGQSKRSALYELFCNDPDSCDLLQKENTCLNCGAMSGCKFGKKIGREGPTRQARSFYKTIDKWKAENEGFIGRLSSLKAYNRIFKASGHYYLPYSFMTKGLGDGNPLESKWVPEGEMNTALLSKICTAEPHAVFGGVISDYQNKEIPKFISDLKMFYQNVFDLLPQEQKARLESVDYVGRKADITTCAPGDFLFSGRKWRWDGGFLFGNSMLFEPVKGAIEIKIEPKAGEPVKITDNSQVTENTRFLD